MVDHLTGAVDKADEREPPMDVWGAMRGAISERNRGLRTADEAFSHARKEQRPKLADAAESLDFALARGLTQLQLWVDGHTRRGRSRAPATDLAEALVDVLKAEAVTEDEIDHIFANKLRAVAWLPPLSLDTAKKHNQRGMAKATLAFEQNWLNPRNRRAKRNRGTK